MKTREDVISWAKQMATGHDSLDNRLEEIARYFRPNQSGFTTERTEGADLEEDIYDSLPMEQADRMSRNLFAWILNPAIKWFEYGFDDSDLKEDTEAKRWIEDATKTANKELTDSNWSMKALQAIFDKVTFGTAMMQLDEKPSLYDEDDGEFRGLMFKSHHMSQSFGEEGGDDKIHNTVVRYKLTPQKAVDLYGYDSLPTQVQADYDGKKHDKHIFLHAIVRRRLARPPENETALTPENRPYWSLHFHLSTDHVVKDDGYYDLTRTMSRYSTTNDSVYGYSPAMKALPDTRVINEAQQKDLNGWGRALDEPLLINSAKLRGGKVENKAKGITDVMDLDKAVKPLTTDRQYQAHLIRLEDKRSQVRQIFLSDELDIPDREKVGQMTAYEIQKRIERILRSAGSVVTSIHVEMLQPMLLAVFRLLLRRGKFGEIPRSVVEKAGANVLNVKMLGPLAKAQRGEDADIIRNFVADMVGLAGALPPSQGEDLLDNVDLDTAVQMTAEAQGIPTDVMRDEAAREKRRNERREQALAIAAASAGEPGGEGPTGAPVA